MSLENKIIIVTGASRGIGAAMAALFLKRGATVIGSYASDAGMMKDLIDQYGAQRMAALQAEFSQPASAEIFFNTVKSKYPRIDGMVNNAGIMPETPITVSMDDWHHDWSQTMQVNVQAVADLCKMYVTDSLNNNTAAQIVNIASRAAYRGDGPDYWHYAASKGAITALTKTIARAYARNNIHAYTIAPGWVRTDMASVAFEEGNEYMLDEIPLGRAAEPAEIAEIAAMLLSGACNSATGSVFDINGASHVR